MVKVLDYIDVKKKAQELGCNVPNSIALLPRNFETAKSKDELIHESTTPTVRTLWRQNAITESLLEKPMEKFPVVDEKEFEWISPTIFIPAMLISQNPHLITVALNVISSYLADWFKGILRINRKVKLSIITETKSGSNKRIEYEGTEDGLKNLPKVIREVYNE